MGVVGSWAHAPFRSVPRVVLSWSSFHSPAALHSYPLMHPAGFLASLAYQVLFTWPRRQRLVLEPLARFGSPAAAAALLALFGCLFNVHMHTQAATFKSDGAIGVGLTNAVRGAVLTVAIAALFCDADSERRRHLCLSVQAVTSAAVITGGGLVYVLGGGGGQGQQQPAATKPEGEEERQQQRQQELERPRRRGKAKDA